MTQLCDLSPPNLKELLQKAERLNKLWEDDWQFYLNMCEIDQVGSIAGRDLKLAIKEGEKVVRISDEEKRKVQFNAQKIKVTQAVSGAEFDEGGDYEHGSKDGDVVYKETKVKRNKDKDRVILQIDPH